MCLLGGAYQPDGVAEPVRILKVDWLDATDPVRVDLGRSDLFDEGQG